MEVLTSLIGTANGYLWSNAMLILCFGSGLVFTIMMKVPQIRMIPEMVKLLFNGQSSNEGLSSFQAFTLAIAGRVGVGNIAGVATAVCMGGPGAIFWMWMVALIGSATSFVECSLSQLHKSTVNGEYRGGWFYYIGHKWGWLGAFTAALFAITMPLTQTSLHANNIAAAAANAFGVPKIAVGILIAVLLALIVFGGAKRIGHAAEMIVPVMATVYILVALLVIFLNADKIPSAFAMIVSSAFGKNQVIGAAMGSAMIWGTKRAIFSSETGMTTATPSAASANVSHPAKQGLVQAFSIYIDTLFVCTATGLMLVVSGMFNVQGADGQLIYTGLSDAIEAGPVWVSEAINTVLPIGAPFIAIAIFFFGFTSIMNHNYSTVSAISYFFKDGKMPKWAEYGIDVLFLIGAVFGTTVSTLQLSWDIGDMFLGACTWINYLFLLLSGGVAAKLLKDYETQKKAGKDPVFDPDQFAGESGFDFDMSLWRSIRDRFNSGELKN